MKKVIQFGSKAIEYSLQYNGRKTLGITVTPELDVIVKAPMDAAVEKIEQIVRKRAPWILKQREFFLAFFPKQPPKRYVSGETHLYLGRQYLLKVVHGRARSVKLTGRYLFVTCPQKEEAKRLVRQWYLERAYSKFNSYVKKWTPHFKNYDVTPSEIVLREMSRRWGSCTAKHKIILNPELIKAPKACIEYVIVHELCHLVHHSHNRAFMDLQSKMMPQWERWKVKLESLLA